MADGLSFGLFVVFTALGVAWIYQRMDRHREIAWKREQVLRLVASHERSRGWDDSAA